MPDLAVIEHEHGLTGPARKIAQYPSVDSFDFLCRVLFRENRWVLCSPRRVTGNPSLQHCSL